MIPNSFDFKKYTKKKNGGLINLSKLGTDNFLLIIKGYDEDTGIVVEKQKIKLNLEKILNKKNNLLSELAEINKRLNELSKIEKDIQDIDL